ncbi:MAG: (Fe-S)-binding protein [Thermoplasmata archaeon]
MTAPETLERITSDCNNCGFCEAACPTFKVTYASSTGARGRVNIAKYLVQAEKSGMEPDRSFLLPFYSCLECSACLTVCPVGIDAGQVSRMVREDLVGRGVRSKIADAIVKVTMRYESPLGLKGKMGNLLRWTEFPGRMETLLYTGQMYQLSGRSSRFSKAEELFGERISGMLGGLISRFPCLMKVASIFLGKEDKKYREALKNITRLLSESGVQFTVMEREPYPGTFLLDLGYEKEFRQYASSIASKFWKLGFRKIITVDPHTYVLLKYEYPRYVEDFRLQVFYYTDLLKPEIFRRTGKSLTYHDPCHLSRGNGEVVSPLNLLNAGYDVSLPSTSGRMTGCCGGPDELLFPRLSKGISKSRYEELASTGSGTIVTACPVCLSNLAKHGRVEDVSALLVEALK